MINNLYWGSIDISIFIILIIVNIVAFRKLKNRELGCIIILILVLLYGIILPVISQVVEISRVVEINGVDDSFTLLYTYLRYPIYWFLGFIQLIMIVIFNNSPKNHSKDGKL